MGRAEVFSGMRARVNCTWTGRSFPRRADFESDSLWCLRSALMALFRSSEFTIWVGFLVVDLATILSSFVFCLVNFGL